MKPINPHEIERLILLSLVLEPLAEKEGCTTRSVDLDETIRLQHLQAAAINVAKYFYLLAERIEQKDGQPETFFDIPLSALKDAQRNIKNNGKYINQGLITLLAYVLVASLTTNGDGVQVLKKIPEVLKNSSRKDAEYRNEFSLLVSNTSRKENKRKLPSISASNLFEYYEKRKNHSEELGYFGGVIWPEQLIQGLPVVQQMYLEGRKVSGKGLLKVMEVSYDTGRKLLPKNSPGFIADYTGAVAFLILREVSNSEIIL